MKVSELIAMLQSRAADAEVILMTDTHEAVEIMPRLYPFEIWPEARTHPKVVILRFNDQDHTYSEYCDLCHGPILEGQGMTAVEMGYAGRARPSRVFRA